MEGPTRVLLVEDDPSAAQALRSALEAAPHGSFEVRQVASLHEALCEVNAHHYGAMLLDLSLPDASGLDTIVRAREGGRGTPIVVLCEVEDHAVALESLQKGAQDYLVKGRDCTAALLERSLHYAIERDRLMRELAGRQERELRERDQFLSHVSHELRTPLSAAYQFVSLVRDGIGGALTSEQAEFVDTAFENIRQLERMTGDLLESARVPEAGLCIEPTPLELSGPIADAVRSFALRASENDVRLDASLAPDLERVHADAGRVRQVLGNLLENALRFTPRGGRIRVVAGRHDAAHARVSVIDTGSGVPLAARDRIFERLHQEDRGERSRSGLGLGLFICRQIVSRHGGEIWVEDADGGGSAFHFTLPLVSVRNQLEPLVANRPIGATGLAVIRVQIGPDDPESSVSVDREVLSHAYRLLRGCVATGVDVLLPRMGRVGLGEVFVVAGWMDSVAEEMLMARIRDRLARSARLRVPNLQLEVSGGRVVAPAWEPESTTLDRLTTWVEEVATGAAAEGGEL